MKKALHKYISILLCTIILFTLPGCASTKDLNPTASELLKVAATELGLNEGTEAPDHIIITTYDITAFEGMPMEEFEKWVLEECGGENIEVIVVTDTKECWESTDQAEEYLKERGYSQEEIWESEWVEYRFKLEEEKTELSAKEKVVFSCTFRTYNNEGFGEEVNCRYKKGEWTAEEAVSTWIS